MAKNRLSARATSALEPGKHCDGAGLWLVKSNRKAGKWVLRITVFGKRREMGLGPWPDVPLSEAGARRRSDFLADAVVPLSAMRRCALLCDDLGKLVPPQSIEDQYPEHSEKLTSFEIL